MSVLLVLHTFLCALQLEGMLSPFGELKDCVVIVEKMTQKSKVRVRLWQQGKQVFVGQVPLDKFGQWGARMAGYRKLCIQG